MAKLSYKKQVSVARRRLKRLKAEGIDNNAMKVLNAELNAFYSKNRLTKRGKGIAIDDRMTPDQKRQMSNIITGFLNDPSSTLSGIKERYEEFTGTKATSAKAAADLVDMESTVLLSDEAIVEGLKSQVVHDIYEQQQREGFDPDAARYAMSRYFIENDIKGKSVNQIVGEIQDYLKNVKDIAPEFWEDSYEEW